METNIGNNNSNYICKICNKIYTNKSGIWKHNNKYHNVINNHNDKHTIIIDNHNIINNTINDNPNIIINNHNDNVCNYNCNKCNKTFSCYQNRWRHQKTCKFINTNKEEEKNENKIINQLVQQLNEQKEQLYEQKKMFEKQISEMKNQLIETMNKNCKVHPKTLQKINKQLNCDNINNGTINNTYNIIGLGHENLTEVFSKKEKMAILKNRFYCLPELVEYAHFNDKYPQFKNILITNTQNTLAYKYDTKKKQFVAVNKDELLDDIVDERMCDINSFYDELENDLDERTKEIIEKVKDKIENDPAYKELKKKDIKLIIYNNRKKVMKDNLLEDEIDV